MVAWTPSGTDAVWLFPQIRKQQVAIIYFQIPIITISVFRDSFNLAPLCGLGEAERCCLMFPPCPHCAGRPERHPIAAPLVCKSFTSLHTGLQCSCWWRSCRAEQEKDGCPLSKKEKISGRGWEGHRRNFWTAMQQDWRYNVYYITLFWGLH